MKIDKNTHVLVPDGYKSHIIKRPDGMSKKELNSLIRKKIAEYDFYEKHSIVYHSDKELQIIELDLRCPVDFTENKNLTPVFSIGKKIAQQYRDCVCIVYLHVYSCVVTIKDGFLRQYNKVGDNVYDAEIYIKRLIKFNLSNNESSIILSDIMIESLDIEKIKMNDELLFIKNKYEKLKSFSRICQVTNALNKQFDLNLIFFLVISILASVSAYNTYNIKGELEMKIRNFENSIDEKLSDRDSLLQGRLEKIDEVTKLTKFEVSKFQTSVGELKSAIEFNSINTKKNHENLLALFFKQFENISATDKLDSKKSLNVNNTPTRDFKIELKMIIDDVAIIKVQHKDQTKLLRLCVGQTIKFNRYLTLKLENFNSLTIDNKLTEQVYRVAI